MDRARVGAGQSGSDSARGDPSPRRGHGRPWIRVAAPGAAQQSAPPDSEARPDSESCPPARPGPAGPAATRDGRDPSESLPIGTSPGRAGRGRRGRRDPGPHSRSIPVSRPAGPAPGIGNAGGPGPGPSGQPQPLSGPNRHHGVLSADIFRVFPLAGQPGNNGKGAGPGNSGKGAGPAREPGLATVARAPGLLPCRSWAATGGSAATCRTAAAGAVNPRAAAAGSPSSLSDGAAAKDVPRDTQAARPGSPKQQTRGPGPSPSVGVEAVTVTAPTGTGNASWASRPPGPGSGPGKAAPARLRVMLSRRPPGLAALRVRRRGPGAAPELMAAAP